MLVTFRRFSDDMCRSFQQKAEIFYFKRQGRKSGSRKICTVKENDHLEGTICIDLETVRLWDNHDPYLYHAYVELKAEDGSLVEVIPYDIGIQKQEDALE